MRIVDPILAVMLLLSACVNPPDEEMEVLEKISYTKLNFYQMLKHLNLLVLKITKIAAGY